MAYPDPTSGAFPSQWLATAADKVRDDFDQQSRLLSFNDFLTQLSEDPYAIARNSVAYLIDVFDHFGTHTVDTPIGKRQHFKLFDLPFRSHGVLPLVGQEDVQSEFYRVLHAFLREGLVNRLVLLHGPNGSSKSSFFRCLMAALEQYSRLPQGVLYTFKWVFPIESVYKKSLGLGSKGAIDEPLDSYALLDPEKISTILPNEMRDNPLLLLPTELRKELLVSCLEKISDPEKKERFRLLLPVWEKADLSTKSKQVFEALLTSYKGDLKKVLMHVQVERFYVSKRFQTSAVTVDPQLNVDASARQVTMNRSLSYIPPALQSLNLFELDGELIHANRGVIEFNDLLKRPVDAFKYLLGTCETGIVNVGPSLAYLDEVMVGTCNEIQLDAFREYADFASFQARMEFIRVPYLLRYSQEREIYNQVVTGYSGGSHINPYTTEVLALWAVLTRLRKPQADEANPNLKRILDSLSAYEKAKLYDHAEVPARFTSEESKDIRNHIRDLWNEFSGVPGFEGRFGASPREMKGLLYASSQYPDLKCLSPGRVLEELEDFVKHTKEYEFLRMEASGGYHAHADFVEVVREHYLSTADRLFKRSMGLAEESQFPQMLARYASHLSALLRRERVLNDVTGAFDDPDVNFIARIEDMLGVKKDRDAFRRDVMTQIAAWAHDRAGEKIDYVAIFPDYIERLKSFFHEDQKKVVSKMLQAVLDLDKPQRELETKLTAQAQDVVRQIKNTHGFCDTCFQEAASLLLKHRYS